MASLLGAGLLAGCLPLPRDSGATGPPSDAHPGPSPVATPVTRGDGIGAGCAPTSDGVPDAAASGPSIDVDGDGRADRLWLGSPSEGPRTVGLTTASGATTAHLVHLSGPVPLKTLVRLRQARATTGVTQAGTFREPQDHERIQALTSVSCGALTIDDGVSEPRPDGGGGADPSVRVGNR